MENLENNLHKKSDRTWDELTDYPNQDQPFPFPDRFKTEEDVNREEEENLGKAA